MTLTTAVLAALVFVTLYILVGYPVLLAKFPWRFAPPARKDPTHQPSVTVLMAVHDGETFVRAKLESLLQLNYPRHLLEVVVISDGSTDGTDAIVSEFAASGVRLIRIERGGKAAALNAGLKVARGEILFYTDVRQLLDSEALRHLVANFADPSVGAVTGELRFQGEAEGEQVDFGLYWRYELWARSMHSRIDSLLNTTGCLYCLRRDLATELPTDTLTDDGVIPMRAHLRGFRVIFEPMAIAYDFQTQQGSEYSRRLRTLAGLWQMHSRMPELLSSRNRMRLHLLSHKSSRLALPWVLLGVVLLAGVGPVWLWGAVYGATLLGLLLAAVDPLVPAKVAIKRLTSPARTFVLLNLASMLSVRVLFVPPQTVWKPTKVRVSKSDIASDPNISKTF
jgi:cellulose synthase/poly-beta-1,6-N-acetylglucosamine synthase-like glycosyltransferase